MTKLSEADLAVIVRLRQEQKGSDDLAKEFGVHKRTIRRALARNRANGSPGYLKSPGRPRKTSGRENRRLVLVARQNPRATGNELKRAYEEATGKELSRMTIAKRLREEGIRQVTLKEKPLLTKAMKKRRREWAAQLVSEPPSAFFPYVFTDEVRICLYQSDSKKKMAWIKPSESLLARNIKPTLKHPPWLHVWAGISLQGRTRLAFMSKGVGADEYIDMLKTTLLPDVEKLSYNGRLVLLQDGAPAHTADRTFAFLDSRGVEVAEHPPYSPDLNPIEQCWPHLKRACERHNPTSLSHLRDIVKAEWSNLDAGLIESLCLSYPRRIRACADAKGGHTKY